MKIKILLIEDDLDDIELLQDALQKHAVLFDMKNVKDGGAAIDFIDAAELIPDIIVLDMNLPKVHGREVILKIKESAVFKDIPLLILTTSSAKEDIEYSYLNGADKYLIKPSTVEGIAETVDTITSLVTR